MTWLALIALAGPPPDPLLAALEEIRAGERPCKELVARYTDGDDDVGVTVVRVAKGWTRVTRTEPGQEKQTWRGRLPRGLCERLVTNALDGKLWTARSKRKKPVQGETRPTIQLGTTGQGRFTVRMWDYDIQNKAVFAIARAQLLLIARRVSKGAVRY